MNIHESTVLVTGAAGGIGSAIAERLGQQGAALLLTDLREEALAQVVQRLRGARVATVAADITTEAGRTLLAEMSRAAGVNVLVNVAGINPFGLFAEQSDAEIEATLRLNVLAPMLLTRRLLPALRERFGAHIVNVGSTFGSLGFPGFCTYSASKFALHGFSEALRRELADSSIRVHYLAPRATRTTLNTDRVKAMNAELRVAMDAPQRVAYAVQRLLEKDRPEAFVGWPERALVKLNALAPRLVDRALRGQLAVIKRHAGATPTRPTPAAQAQISPLNQAQESLS